MFDVRPKTNPWYGALVIAVDLAVISITLAVVFNTFWLWLVALIPTMAALAIGTWIVGG